MCMAEETHHINRLELACVVVTVNLCSHCLQGRRILLNCDDEAIVTVINSGRCKDSVMLS